MSSHSGNLRFAGTSEITSIKEAAISTKTVGSFGRLSIGSFQNIMVFLPGEGIGFDGLGARKRYPHSLGRDGLLHAVMGQQQPAVTE